MIITIFCLFLRIFDFVFDFNFITNLNGKKHVLKILEKSILINRKKNNLVTKLVYEKINFGCIHDFYSVYLLFSRTQEPPVCVFIFCVVYFIK